MDIFCRRINLKFFIVRFLTLLEVLYFGDQFSWSSSVLVQIFCRVMKNTWEQITELEKYSLGRVRIGLVYRIPGQLSSRDPFLCSKIVLNYALSTHRNSWSDVKLGAWLSCKFILRLITWDFFFSSSFYLLSANHIIQILLNDNIIISTVC